MNIDDTLSQIYYDLKIIGNIREENLLNRVGVKSNMKLYSNPPPERLDNLKTSNDTSLRLIICTGINTPRDFFNLKEYNKLQNSK